MIKGIHACLQHQPSLVPESAHALKCLTKRPTPELAEQFLASGIIPFLLKILGNELPGNAYAPFSTDKLQF